MKEHSSKAKAFASDNATNLSRGKQKKAQLAAVYRLGKTRNPVEILDREKLESGSGYLGNTGSIARTFIVPPGSDRKALAKFQEIFTSPERYERRAQLIEKKLPLVNLALIAAIPLGFLFSLPLFDFIPFHEAIMLIPPLAFFGNMRLQANLSRRFARQGAKFAESLISLGAEEIDDSFINYVRESKLIIASPSPENVYKALRRYEQRETESREPLRRDLDKEIKTLLSSENDYMNEERINES